jgi:hypothetical protein
MSEINLPMKEHPHLLAVYDKDIENDYYHRFLPALRTKIKEKHFSCMFNYQTNGRVSFRHDDLHISAKKM